MKIKNRRGIRIQTRIIISALMILLQLFIITLMIFSLSANLLWFYTFIEVLSILLSVHILNKHGNPTYKIAWVVFILIVPFLGVPAYLFWGGGRVLPHLKRRMKKSEEYYEKFLPADEKIKSRLIYDDLIHSRQAAYLSKESGFPLYDGTAAEYLSPGEVVLPRLINELKKAEKFIFIEFFILAEGKMWDEIYSILKKKANEGVEIKIIFDDFGSIKRQRKGFVSQLKNDGISVAIFNKIRPSVDICMNNRNHRKIVVIDGKTALTGGINIADEYINHIERFGYWMDCAIMLHGDAVKSFTIMFLTMWTFTMGEILDGSNYIVTQRTENDGFVLPFCDGPLNERDPAEGIYMQILNTSQRYVYIVTPYLIVNNTMLTAISLAAKSGIDVRIITPKKWDKWYVHPVTQNNYEPLLEAGVKIYEYTPGFIHSKLFVSDDSVATVGTINMDYRSFYIHFECGVWLCRNSEVKNIKNHIDEILSSCEEIKLDNWKKRPFSLKFKQKILSMFSPFM